MRTILVETLVEYLRAQVGTSGADDLLYMWIEEAVGVVREQPWPWNWSHTADITFDPVEPNVLWTWDTGNSYIVAPAPFTSSISHFYTGRRTNLGDEWYTIVDIGLSNPSRIYVDRPIASEELTGIKRTFYRRDRAVDSSKILNVSVDNTKLMRYDPHFFYRRFMKPSPDQVDPSTPAIYKDHQDKRIAPPAYPPVVSDSAAGTGFVTGRYVYFFTRYDAESKLESPPGPKWEGVISHVTLPRVIYGNPASVNDSENTTYGLRLYRSEVDPTRKRTPMFRLLERSPFASVAGAYDDDNKSSGLLYNKTPLYEGQQTVIDLVPPPSDTRLSFVIHHLDNWAFRAHDRDRISMGLDNQVIELLRIFLLGVVKLAAKNPGEYRTGVIQFRQQMTYLSNKARKAADGDASNENYFDDRTSVTNPSGSWVDKLPWSGDS